MLEKRKQKEFQIYTGIWLIAVLILIILLWQNVGDARIINYSGIVRGATQKLVKEELNGQADDTLIARLDGIIYDLQTGEGDYDLSKNTDPAYQQKLADLKQIWEDIKEEIPLVRSGETTPSRLFDLSQQHFEAADRMVMAAEQGSNNKLIRFIIFYILSLVLSVTVFAIVNMRSRKVLEKSLYTDNLTGIFNRKGFESSAAAVLRQDSEQKYVMIEFDVDNFKAINNAYGYALGDQLLRNIAIAVSKWDGNKLCARIDADDFMLLVKDSEEIIQQLENVLDKVIRAQNFLETFGSVSFIFGACRIEKNDELIKTIMDKANTAHKTAKTNEKESVVWYGDELLRKMRMEKKLKDQLYQALAEKEFKMYLQPKFDLNSLEVAGAEALVRWEFPDHGIVYPDAFIPLFEKNGTIPNLDFYMLRQACAYLRDQMDRGGPAFTISVNFSRVSLYRQAFYETFLEIAHQFEIPHNYIEVEITESAFNEVADSVIQMLFRLKDDGFLISMDDFGAGYSSLNMLSKLPLQIIKLDRAFLKEMSKNERVKGIITCAVDLAHSLGIKIVCEGVEHLEDVRFLRKIGCDYGQGYYFSKAIPQEEFNQKYTSFS